MNGFYLISQKEILSKIDYELPNLGKKIVSAVIATPSRNNWGERTHSDQTFYRQTKADDYDGQFSHKLMSIKPI